MEYEVVDVGPATILRSGQTGSFFTSDRNASLIMLNIREGVKVEKKVQ